MKLRYCRYCNAVVPMFDNQEYDLLSKVHQDCIKTVKSYRQEHQLSLDETLLELLFQPFADLYRELTHSELVFDVDEVMRRHYLSRWNDYRYEAEPGEIVHVSMQFPDEGITQTVAVSRIGNDVYRIEDVTASLLGTINYHDIVEVEEKTAGNLVFRQVVEPSKWKSFRCMLSRRITESAQLQELLEEIERQGGLWEIVMGGTLTIVMPPNGRAKVRKRIDELIANVAGNKKK